MALRNHNRVFRPVRAGIEIRNKILLPKCLPCHGKAMSALGLDLETPGAKARLPTV